MKFEGNWEWQQSIAVKVETEQEAATSLALILKYLYLTVLPVLNRQYWLPRSAGEYYPTFTEFVDLYQTGLLPNIYSQSSAELELEVLQSIRGLGLLTAPLESIARLWNTVCEREGNAAAQIECKYTDVLPPTSISFNFNGDFDIQVADYSQLPGGS